MRDIGAIGGVQFDIVALDGTSGGIVRIGGDNKVSVHFGSDADPDFPVTLTSVLPGRATAQSKSACYLSCTGTVEDVVGCKAVATQAECAALAPKDVSTNTCASGRNLLMAGPCVSK